MTQRNKSQVALVKCDSYDRKEVEAAVKKALELLGGLDNIFAEREQAGKVLPALSGNSCIVLKPNLLTKASPEKAVTTHPEVFRAVGKALLDASFSNLKYGDSPGNVSHNSLKTAEECGIRQVADELGLKAGDFDSGTEVKFPEGRTAKKFVLCNEVLQADGIINICKMKTHQLERITGAMKNTYGCVYGINKAAGHALYPTAERFAGMIADLNRMIVPRLHIMDGIVAMEGNGPHSGNPVDMKVILASTDPVALDTVFCMLIHLDRELVPTNTAGHEAGVGNIADDEIEILTSDVMDVKYDNPEFDVQRSRDYRGKFNYAFMKPLYRLLEKKPIILAGRCIGCGICVDTCPVNPKAVRLKDSRAGIGTAGQIAVYDYGKCIKCYCCQEMCPEKAITVRKSLMARIADRKW
ncbi:MAG: DUF362 domain-containing protein [Lentihominibacter sp.]|jgi:uncharacterized protein (DUF362 family)/Pyruvate/2-oxoacid:ferredoxin oxidoreductase delta subunit